MGGNAAASGAGGYRGVWCGSGAAVADRAAACRPGFEVGPDNAETVAAICRALDGLPLAIELAAARVSVLSVEQIKARLDDRFALLAEGDRAGLPRQRTLSATIGWSYDLLTGAERALFRRVSVFAGWSLEMAEIVCSGGEVPAGDVFGLMAALVEKSLVMLEPEVLGQARYRMLDSIREYAAARLAEAEESAALHVALRDYMLRTAEDALTVGMAGDLVPWSARVDTSRRYDVESGTVSQGAGAVPGRRRCGDGIADLCRHQPALDSVGHLRRRRGVAGFHFWPSTPARWPGWYWARPWLPARSSLWPSTGP